MGIRTADEINQERYALKALRGDFKNVTHGNAMQAVEVQADQAGCTGLVHRAAETIANLFAAFRWFELQLRKRFLATDDILHPFLNFSLLAFDKLQHEHECGGGVFYIRDAIR
jgi:hypothetical protein